MVLHAVFGLRGFGRMRFGAMASVGFAFSLLFLFACKAKLGESAGVGDSEKTAAENVRQSARYEWFFFDNTEDVPKIQAVDSPENAPRLLFAPWTQAVHVAASAQYNSGYFFVNHFGMLTFSNGQDDFFYDKLLLESKTIGEVFFLNANPVFHVFTNSIFAKSQKSPKSKNSARRSEKSEAVFIQYDDEAKNFLPMLTKEKLALGENAEVTEAFFKDGVWNLAVKSTETQDEQKISFSYMTLKMPSAETQSISESSFYARAAPEDFSDSPVRIRRLLGALTAADKDYDFTLVCAIEEAMQNRTFRKYAESDGAQDSRITAHAVLTPEYVVALFPDGTCYFSGSLAGRPLLNNGKETAFRLPELGAGFVYTHCIISGKSLFAAWEERSFYKIARSGFIKVDLDAVLYR